MEEENVFFCCTSRLPSIQSIHHFTCYSSITLHNSRKKIHPSQLQGVPFRALPKFNEPRLSFLLPHGSHINLLLWSCLWRVVCDNSHHLTRYKTKSKTTGAALGSLLWTPVQLRQPIHREWRLRHTTSMWKRMRMKTLTNRDRRHRWNAKLSLTALLKLRCGVFDPNASWARCVWIQPPASLLKVIQ